MLGIAIVDDEAKVRGELARMVSRFAEEQGVELAVSEYADGKDFLEAGVSEDIILLDIEMDGMDGMEAAKRLRAAGVASEIIFVTNMAQYAVEGYEVNALDFVVKPVRYPSFSFKLRRAIDNVRRKRRTRVSVQTRDGLRTFETSDIIYIEVIRHKLIYHTDRGEFEAWGTLKNVSGELEPFGFAPCNSCYLVNLDRVTGVSQDMVRVDGGDELKISRSRKKEFINALTNPSGR